MATESPDRSKGTLDSFLLALYRHMAERSDSASKIAHPDPQVREFYRVFLEFAPKFEQQLLAALARRVYLDPTHIADLLLRAAIYLNRSEQPWYDFLQAMGLRQKNDYADIIAMRNVATFIPARYRSLATIASYIATYKPLGLRVTDWGCSLNLGLRYVMQPHLLLGSESGLIPLLEDYTDDVTALLSRRALIVKDAVGIDVVDLNSEEWVDWANACSYGTQQRLSFDVITNDLPIEMIVADVTKDLYELKYSGRLFDLVHASMMTHQLSSSDHSMLLLNAAALLDTGGMFVELTFRTPNVFNQPRNTVTKIRFLLADGSLSEPYQWLEWDNSQCGVVWPGKDFHMVKQHMASREVN